MTEVEVRSERTAALVGYVMIRTHLKLRVGMRWEFALLPTPGSAQERLSLPFALVQDVQAGDEWVALSDCGVSLDVLQRIPGFSIKRHNRGVHYGEEGSKEGIENGGVQEGAEAGQAWRKEGSYAEEGKGSEGAKGEGGR